MIHVENIEELFSSNNNAYKLKDFYTTTKHKKIVLYELNSVLKNNPEYYELIVLLASYPLINWAKKQRELLKLDITEFERSLYNSNHSFLGIRFNRSNYIHRDSLMLSNEIMKILEKIVNDSDFSTDILQAVHVANSKDVSQYRVKKHYKEQIVSVCDKYIGQIKCELHKIDSITLIEDEEFKIAIHNTDLLIRSLHIIKDRTLKKYPNDEIDYNELYTSLIKAINTLRYGEEGNELVEILLSYGDNISIYQMAKNIGRSRNYVRSRIELGTELISYLLFGISYKTILQSLS